MEKINNKTLLDAYKKMLLVRISEEEIAKYYLENKVMSFVHFCVGQEAVAVGVCEALEKGDRIMGNHRSHGHYLAKGGDLKKMVCELLGKADGLAKGKGGSMHMIDKSVDFVGGTPILGSVVPLANGSAFEQKYNNKNNLTVAFCGDGAFEEGIVYETLNLSALFKLPFVLVIENNLYAVNSKIKDRRSHKYNTEEIVKGFGVNYVVADGNDFVDVYTKMVEIVKGVKEGKGPYVFECKTFRHMAHSAPIYDDAQGYREEDLLEVRLEKDCLKKVRKMIETNVASDELNKLEEDTRIFVKSCIDYAVKAPYPNKDSLYTNIYAS